MANTLLFQAQVTLRKIDKEVVFFKGEMWELPDEAGSAFDTVFRAGGERFPVHHNRGDVRVERAQAREDQESLRVQVAPVVDGTIGQPGDTSQIIDHEATAEKREGISAGWQREESHLVLGDDAALPVQQIERRKLRDRNTQFGERQVIPFV